MNSRHLVPLFCVCLLGWFGEYKPVEAYPHVDHIDSIEGSSEVFDDSFDHGDFISDLTSPDPTLPPINSFGGSLYNPPLSIAAADQVINAAELMELENLNALNSSDFSDSSYLGNGEALNNPSQLLQAQNWRQWLRLTNIRVVPDGLLILVNGNAPVNLQRIVSPDRLVVDLASTSIPPNLHKATIPINRYGVRQIRIAQFQKEPAIARIVLDLDPSAANGVNWQSSFMPSRGGILLRPTTNQPTAVNPTPRPPGSSLPVPVPNNPNPSLPSPPNPATTRPGNTNGPSVIQGIQISNTGQLVIQASQGLTYRGSQDIPSNTYNITISAARISPQLQRPALSASSPLERIRLTQVGDSVIIGMKVATGWAIREAGRNNPQQIALQLLNSGNVAQNPTPRPPTPGFPRPNPNVPAVPNLANRGRGVIVIDPGHGGRDPGAVGNGINEKIIMLPLSQRLGQVLQQMGYSVVYTRTSDIELDLEPRVQLAERVRGDVFVSLHANSVASRSATVTGIETYYAPGSTRGRRLAALVHSQVIAATGAVDRRVRSARFYVLRRTSMPAILVETGFVTNPGDAARLRDPNYQQRIAEAIARGVDQFLRGG
ncbi:cell wall hydrolase/autolysin [Thalassoporum mexicanum PCC 7367]|uniref:N-acetylmuramoyl-L-alanine amidase n=1 Tax=Thalassoporum mexicanum TaxID=3457544 RepID=UPI00029F9A86|nr:N-acetylmuramoyl-L-alanine amidase [Pseudanabaena sp. PCC 7367]AFY70366.1 cell wall hydrolase/autolysin [Pseudanabaena sp. PCC 7367]